MTDPTDLAAWLEANAAPNPQALAERYGGYSRVPVEASEQFLSRPDMRQT
jgi:hypothetical protein